MRPTRARAHHAADLVRLRDSCARWQRRRGIEQWAPGEVAPEQVRSQIERGEWWLVQDGAPVAAVRVLEEDPQVWPDPGPVPAYYVHGLMVDRGATGRGLGERLLAWVEHTATDAGRGLVRLDCVSAGQGLRAYYERLGYRPRGEVTFPAHLGWHPVTRYEKTLTWAGG
ncbi:GNAT family N-acetyltransferase [Nocardiopsis sp. MG754419]|uniref:GNAT family N-acetyltransferase n=1 Tax=Nocardiopsis sp. MG754419 TaxID=2259865 RepID=UPI001BAC9618|nr:GNAT family N-acetyltransferase [Nocardiopsis sp. MG754419]